MEIDSYDYHLGLFTMHPYFFVTDHFKTILEESDFNLKFQKLDQLRIGLNLTDSIQDHGFQINSFYRVLFDPGDEHFILHENNLVVSQKALDFLLDHKAFKFNIYGGVYGKEYEYVDNLYYIRGGSIQEYFDRFYDEDRAYIETKARKMHDQYRLTLGI